MDHDNGGGNNGGGNGLPPKGKTTYHVGHRASRNKTDVPRNGRRTTYNGQNLSSGRRSSGGQRSSSSGVASTNMQIGSLGWKEFLLSFRGRLSASAYVVSLGGLIVLTSISYYILLPMCMFLPGFIKVLAMIGYILLLTWIGIAITVRRLHDLGHNGWWFLICLIPFLNVLLIIYLGFWKGEAGENLYGVPTSPAPLPFAILCYPIFALAMFLNLLPAASIIPGINKLPGVGYLVPSSEMTDAKDVQQYVDSMPGIVRDEFNKDDVKRSTALVLMQGQMVAAGAFVTENRILINSARRGPALQSYLSQQKNLQVKSVDKEARLTRLVASSPSEGWYVFEADQKIGTPSPLMTEDERNKLAAIGAFK